MFIYIYIATNYEPDDPGIESRWWWEFPSIQTGPGAHPASCKMGTGSFPGVKCGRGMLLTTHPLLVPRSWKSRAIPLLPLWATTGPVTGLLYFLLLHIYVVWCSQQASSASFHRLNEQLPDKRPPNLRRMSVRPFSFLLKPLTWCCLCALLYIFQVTSWE
jgi:hypothetical protein